MNPPQKPTQNSLERPIEKSTLENIPSKRVLTYQERISLGRTMSILGYGTPDGDYYTPGSQGAGPVQVPWIENKRMRLNAQQKEVKRVLDEGSPRPVSPEERDRLKKLADTLKEQFTKPEYFQSRNECRVIKRDKPEFFSALEKAKKWQTPQANLHGRSPQELADAWRNIMRTLEPEDEQADSLDRLRVEKY